MKTVLITGAGSGIGKALAQVFAKNGWEVIAATHKDLDVASQKSIEAFVKKLNGKSVDVLINNAGVYDSGSVDRETVVSTVDDVTNVLKVNTIGPRALSEALLPNLKKGTEKLVVTISSVMGTYAALDTYTAEHWPYSLSKNAVNYAMTSFSKLNPTIKIVLIHPGWVKTKIGGSGAQLEPEFSAGKIFELIQDHKSKLKNGEFVDYEGKSLEF